jgi:hypothetical protein
MPRAVLGGGAEPGDHMVAYNEGWFFSSHSWHFFTVPPYSQYYLSYLGSAEHSSRPSRGLGRRGMEGCTSGGRVQTGSR